MKRPQAKKPQIRDISQVPLKIFPSVYRYPVTARLHTSYLNCICALRSAPRSTRSTGLATFAASSRGLERQVLLSAAFVQASDSGQSGAAF